MASRRKYRGRKDRLRFAQLWVLIFIPVYLLLPGFKGYSGISPFKTWLYYGLAAMLLVGTLIALAERPKRPGENGADLRARIRSGSSRIQAAALCYLFWTLLSACFSPYGADAWYNEKAHETAVTILLYILMYLCLARSDSFHPHAKRALLIALSCFAFVSLLQLFGLNPFGLYPNNWNYYDGYGKQYTGAFLGTMGNVDLVSVFLCTAIPILLIYAWKGESSCRWWALGLAGVCLAILLWMHVLCGIVGLAMGLTVCCCVLLPKTKNQRLIWVGAVLALGLAALGILWVWDPPVNFLHEIHEILHGNLSDRFGTGRIFIWRQMLERIPDRLLLGTGPDTVRLTGLEPFRRYDEAGTLVAQASLTDAHCFPLHILYCQGLPAMLSWLVMVGLALRRWWKHRDDPVAAALGAGLLCWVCAMLFCLTSVILQPWFWLLLGLMESRTRLSDRKSERD